MKLETFVDLVTTIGVEEAFATMTALQDYLPGITARQAMLARAGLQAGRLLAEQDKQREATPPLPRLRLV